MLENIEIGKHIIVVIASHFSYHWTVIHEGCWSQCFRITRSQPRMVWPGGHSVYSILFSASLHLL